MDCNTGHLVRNLEMVYDEARARYDELPETLRLAATLKLNGADEAMVSLTSGGKLSQFAGETRKQRRLNRKRYIKQLRKESAL